MKKLITVSVIAISLAFAGQSFAAAPPAPKKGPEAAKPAGDMKKKEAKSAAFKGIVKKLPDGLTLVTKDGGYLLTGGNFDDLIDKEVEVKGKATTEGSVKKIQVAEVKPAAKGGAAAPKKK